MLQNKGNNTVIPHVASPFPNIAQIEVSVKHETQKMGKTTNNAERVIKTFVSGVSTNLGFPEGGGLVGKNGTV